MGNQLKEIKTVKLIKPALTQNGRGVSWPQRMSDNAILKCYHNIIPELPDFRVDSCGINKSWKVDGQVYLTKHNWHEQTLQRIPQNLPHTPQYCHLHVYNIKTELMQLDVLMWSWIGSLRPNDTSTASLNSHCPTFSS